MSNIARIWQLTRSALRTLLEITWGNLPTEKSSGIGSDVAARKSPYSFVVVKGIY